VPKKITTNNFIVKSNLVHNNYYDYSQVLYINMHSKVKIIDPVYGEFWQTPMGHLQGQGHPTHGKLKAANSRRTTVEEFIKKANKKHNNLYDYSKVIYTHCDDKVCIIDPEFGEFWQSPYQHLNSHGCPNRTKNKKWEIHYDHIIPLSIIRSSRKKLNEWSKERPLYKFLDSKINLTPVKAKFNIDKNDTVTINNKTISASSIRNNYDLITYLIKTILNVDPTDIINKDKDYISNYFDLM
jgi:hypothetical protein